MPQSDFLPFATGAGANVETQASYAANGAVGSGYTAGIAQSLMLNKTWRQGTFVAAAVAQFLLEQLNIDILDDGNLEGFVTNLRAALTTLQPRQVLTAPSTNFYVNSVTGSDSNNGTSAATAWQTIQHAANTVLERLDFNGQIVTINLANGNYAPFSQSGNPIGCFGPPNLIYNGSVANPGNVTIHSSAPGTAACSFGAGAAATLQGVTISTAGDAFSQGILATGGSTVWVNNVVFGASSANHVAVTGGAGLYMMGPYTISGGAASHWSAAQGATVGTFGEPVPGVVSPFSVTITGTPAFSLCFAHATQNGTIAVVPTVLTAFTGPVTGTRFIAESVSSISVNGGGVNYFPGSVAGTASATTYGVYNA